MTNIFNNAKHRVSHINWENLNNDKTDKDNYIYLLLVKEYLIRAEKVIDTYSLDNNPFFSAANSIKECPNVNIDFPELERIKNGFYRAICEVYLEWMFLLSNKNEIATIHHDLYDPLIMLFEKGGKIGLRHSEVQVGPYSFPLRIWREMMLDEPLDIGTLFKGD